VVRKGDGRMPAFEGKPTDAEITAVAAHAKQLAR